MIDMAIFQNRSYPTVAKFEIERNNKKLTVYPHAINIEDHMITLTTSHVPFLPYDKNDFYLAEDLLDKQVIDITGKRLVRVNDIALEKNGELKVAGIDVGIGGILRRVGLEKLSLRSRLIPWEFIEAFDYQTGNIKIKLTQNKLNSLHPSEIADILENAGVKERMGIVAALETKKAARAIEESNSQTQISILEQLPVLTFKDLLNKIHTSELADIFNYLNPMKMQEIQRVLKMEKAQNIKKLLQYSDDVAGGLMRPNFFAVKKDKTAKEVSKYFSMDNNPPEAIVVINGNDRFVGVVHTKDLVGIDPLVLMNDIIRDRKFVYTDLHFWNIFSLFAEYNLRLLPVVDKDKKPIGIIVLDDLLKALEEKKEKDETVM